MVELTAQVIDLGLDRRRLEQDREEAIRELDQLLKELGTPAARSAKSNELIIRLDEDHGLDLERVKGIGPKTAVLLAAEGIVDLTTLIDLDEKRISEIAQRRPGIADRLVKERWQEQAKSARDGSVLEPEKRPDHVRRSPPEDLTIEIKEPDLSPLPWLEPPAVRFGQINQTGLKDRRHFPFRWM
jgi:predicted flap endonuclease-1-like 5' DNA nuclease